MAQTAHNFVDSDYSQHHKPDRPSRWGSFLLLALIVFLLGGCVRLIIGRTAAPNDPLAYDPVTLDPKPPEGLLKRIGHFVFSRDVTLAGERKDRINILLLGMGGEGHDGPYLTDTIIIASVKPSTGEVALISIPRDLGVKISGNTRKINSANSLGEVEKPGWGAVAATETIEDTFDISIHYYVRIDFKAFEEIINEVGGITVNVERSFADHTYPDANYGYQSVTFTQGITTMNGDTALKYARSRHGNNGEGSDFARARRQQKMLLALKKKVLSFSTLSNPIRINNIIKTLDNHITTNMEFSDIIALMKLAKEVNTANMKTVVLDSSVNGFLENGFSEDGAFILRPKSGSFKEINKLIENIFDENVEIPAIGVPTPLPEPAQEAPAVPQSVIEIQNGTWRAGMAARMKKRLEDRGFNIGEISNTEERPQLASGIYELSNKEKTHEVAAALQTELHVAVKQAVPDKITHATSTDILVILGEDIQEE